VLFPAELGPLTIQSMLGGSSRTPTAVGLRHTLMSGDAQTVALTHWHVKSITTGNYAGDGMNKCSCMCHSRGPKC
jgi:hypothetical protein